MELRNKKILVAGLGKTGISVCKFLVSRGAIVSATDTSDEDKLGTRISDLKALGVDLILGEQKNETFESQDLIILSPGVPHTIPPVQAAKNKSIQVIGEIELASRFISEPIIAVTGTNGKTTTTTLISEMLKSSGLKVFTGGNIGTPLIDYLIGNNRADVLVIEISSFQLDTIETFHPQVGVILNITPDHLDRYENMDAYALSKAGIFKNQTKDDIAVIKASDTYISENIRNIKSQIFNFDTKTPSEKGAMIEKDTITFQSDKTNFVLYTNDLPLNGKHNFENVSAAVLSALSAGGTKEGIISALKNFSNLSHRIEYVDTVNEVSYYDDSKATNVDAVLRALDSFEKPVILIIGGRDKGSNFNLLKHQIKKNVKKMIVIGEAKKLIVSALGQYTDTVEADSMANAVFMASESASPGDVVLLSPACASFDMYSSYAERGKDFSNCVSKLKEKQI